jgi:hypothetical protein
MRRLAHLQESRCTQNRHLMKQLGGAIGDTCRYLRVASSFMMCAAPPTFMPVACEIFSRDERS